MHQERTIEEAFEQQERPTIPVPRAQLTDAYLLAEWRKQAEERDRNAQQ